MWPCCLSVLVGALVGPWRIFASSNKRSGNSGSSGSSSSTVNETKTDNGLHCQYLLLTGDSNTRLVSLQMQNLLQSTHWIKLHRFMQKQFHEPLGFRKLKGLGELRICFQNKEWFCDLQLEAKTLHPPSKGNQRIYVLRVPPPSAAPDLVIAAHGLWDIGSKQIPRLSSEERFKEQVAVLADFTRRNVTVRWVTNFPFNSNPTLTNAHVTYDRHGQGEVAKKHGFILCDLYHAVQRKQLNVSEYHFDQKSARKLAREYLALLFEKKEPRQAGRDNALIKAVYSQMENLL
eukprot:g59346.t1